jgi:hypothetical protein
MLQDRGLLLLKVGAFNGLLATILAAVGFAFVGGVTNGFSTDIAEILLAIPLLLPITAVSCGLYGFLASVTASAWILSRRKQSATLKQLLTRSTVVGSVLGVAFLFVDRAVNLLFFGASADSTLTARLLLCIPVGVCCAVCSALFFRKRFIAHGTGD